MVKNRLIILAATLALLATACGGGAGDTTTTAGAAPTTAAPTTAAPTTAAPTTTAPTTTAPPAEGGLSLDAAAATISVDGDPSDWEAIEGLSMTLEPIEGEDISPHEATIKVAYDAEYVYVLFTVEDDYDWTEGDPHLSGSVGVMWAVDPAAGAHMGVEAEDGEGPSLGTVDIWHWELDCGPGGEQGGSVSEPGEGKDPGNDSACNFDDEWATDPETREDDNTDTGENGLLGVYTHSAQTKDADGTWYFEMSRPLDTGDGQDAVFGPGTDALLAVAYWDADSSDVGWDDDHHVISSNQGWITVAFR